jgi:hypothetical protein
MSLNILAKSFILFLSLLFMSCIFGCKKLGFPNCFVTFYLTVLSGISRCKTFQNMTATNNLSFVFENFAKDFNKWPQFRATLKIIGFTLSESRLGFFQSSPPALSPSQASPLNFIV